MTSPSVSPSPIVGQANDLDRLAGICDEISALVRTGLPLEESLLLMSRSKRGQVGRKLRELAETLGTGKSLADAVRDDPSFPPVFSAVVEAGLESGNLSGALEAISDSVRSLRDTRLFLLRSSLYPLILFTTLWLVFSFLVFAVAPKFNYFFNESEESFFLFDFFVRLRSVEYGISIFTLGVPGVLWMLYFLWGFCSARNNVIQKNGSSPLFRWMPWVGSATVELQKASFAKILSMLLRYSMPLDRALLLAAQASNDRYWSRKNLESLRNRIAQGTDGKKPDRAYPKSALSPLIEWSLGISNRNMLLEGIDHYAKIARTRADLSLSKCEMFLPAFLTFLLATSIGACYCLTIFWPYIRILHFLTEPIS